MKECNKCRKIKDLSCFRPHRTRGLQSSCIECRAVYNRAHYVKDREKYRSRTKVANAEKKKKFFEFIDSFKDLPCTDCSRCWPPEAMDFDHLPQFEKEYGISRMWHKSEEEILEEVKKCELVCACCHRIRTQQRNTRIA